MEADLLSRIGTSNGCTVGSSVHSVVVIGNLLRGHGSMRMRGGKSQSGREGKWKVLYSINMVGNRKVTACRGSSNTLSGKEHPRRCRCSSQNAKRVSKMLTVLIYLRHGNLHPRACRLAMVRGEDPAADKLRAPFEYMTEECQKKITPWRGVEPRSRAVSWNDRRVY
jgi:hypothetical protein